MWRAGVHLPINYFCPASIVLCILKLHPTGRGAVRMLGELRGWRPARLLHRFYYQLEPFTKHLKTRCSYSIFYHIIIKIKLFCCNELMCPTHPRISFILYPEKSIYTCLTYKDSRGTSEGEQASLLVSDQENSS